MRPSRTTRRAVSLFGDGIGVAVEHEEWPVGSVPDDERVAEPFHRQPPRQTELEGGGDLFFIPGFGANLDQFRQRFGESAHTGTSKVRSASLREVLRSVDSVRIPMIKAHCRS